MSEKQLRAAVARAQKFSPQLSQFSLATTSPNDAVIQQVARGLCAPDGTEAGVYVWSWDEIEAEVVCRPLLMKYFYPQCPFDAPTGRLRIPVSAPRDKLQAYFNRPSFSSVPRLIHSRLIQVCYELSDNAFAHGKATTVEVDFDSRRLVVEDNGVEFNPLAQLEHLRAGADGHIGSLVMQHFRQSFAGDAVLDYTRTESANKVTIDFREPLPVDCREVLDLHVETSAMFGRRGAEQYGDSLPLYPGIRELVLTFTDDHFMSGIHMLVRRVRERLDPGAILIVSHPRNSMIGQLSVWYTPETVDFRPR